MDARFSAPSVMYRGHWKLYSNSVCNEPYWSDGAILSSWGAFIVTSNHSQLIKNHWHTLSIFCIMCKHTSPSLVAKLPVHFHGSLCVWPTGIPTEWQVILLLCVGGWSWHFVGCFVFFAEVHCQTTNTLITYHKKWDRVWHFASEKDCATAFPVHKLVC